MEKFGVDRRVFTAIDLFCGAGGLSAALESAGYRTIAAVDSNRDAIDTLRASQAARLQVYPDSSGTYLQQTRLLCADVRDLSANDLRPRDAPEGWRPDLLAGGPPCQPFSSAGRGLALNDPRGRLFTDFIRLAGELNPRMILFENVAGLVTAKSPDGMPGGVLRLVQKSFEELGYACRVELLNAADFGAPQRRIRLYLVAVRDRKLPRFPLPTHSKSNDLPDDRKPWVSLGSLLAGSPIPDSADVVRPSGKRARELQRLKPGTGLRSTGIIEANRPGGHWGYRQDSFLADLTLPSRTIRAAATPDWVRQSDGSMRRLTWRECAAVQGFPPGWVFVGGSASRFRQIGNAVQGDVGRAIAACLLGQAKSHIIEKPVSAPWPAAFHRRVRYTAMEGAVNGKHRMEANDQRRREVALASV